MCCRKVRLVNIEGNQAEYADLIGLDGTLRIDPTSSDPAINWFNPHRSGETLSLARKRVIEKNGRVKVFTKLGNCFTFRLEVNPVL